MPPKLSSSESQDMLFYMVKGILQMCMKILRLGDDTGLFGWPNAIISIPVRERSTAEEEKGCDNGSRYSGDMAQEWSLEAGKSKEAVLPWSVQEKLALSTS